jgi:plasmid stability protein
MPGIHIRNVPEDVVESLKRRAARNRRSLQKELTAILCSVAKESPPVEPVPPLRLKLSKASAEITWRRDEIYGDDGR